MHYALKEIHMTNVQSILQADMVDLPEKGIIRFYGNNSNGKSVLFKFINEMVNDTVFSKAARLDLINWSIDTPPWCEVTFVRNDDLVLTVHVHEEAAQCWSEFYYKDKAASEGRKRTPASSKLLSTYVATFGFHCGSGCSLNLADQDDALMFFGTSPRETFDIVDTALTDKHAVAAIDELKRVKNEAMQSRKNSKDVLTAMEHALSTLEVEDIAKLQERADKLRELQVYAKFKVPKVTLTPLEKPKAMPMFKLPVIKDIPALLGMPVLHIDFDYDFKQLWTAIRDVRSVLDGECPTCKRKLIEERS